MTLSKLEKIELAAYFAACERSRAVEAAYRLLLDAERIDEEDRTVKSEFKLIREKQVLIACTADYPRVDITGAFQVFTLGGGETGLPVEDFYLWRFGSMRSVGYTQVSAMLAALANISGGKRSETKVEDGLIKMLAAERNEAKVNQARVRLASAEYSRVRSAAKAYVEKIVTERGHGGGSATSPLTPSEIINAYRLLPLGYGGLPGQ